MKTSVCFLAGLLIACSALTAAANAAESYDVTTCWSSTVTTLSASDELTVLSIDTKGIARSNTANKAFDNSTFQCVNLVKVAGAQRDGTGYCKVMDPDGDFSIGVQAFNANGGTYKFLQGTGKWKGITGGGEFVYLTSGKAIVAGTSQGCAKATGNYELPK